MFADYFLNAPQFFCTKAKITRKTYRIQPELGRLIITVHVNVRWLVRLVTVEVDALRTGVQYGRHNNVQHLRTVVKP